MDIISSESLEQKRIEAIGTTLDAMMKVLNDSNAPFEDKQRAAKIIDGISDSQIKARLLEDALKNSDKAGNKLAKQLGDLLDEK